MPAGRLFIPAIYQELVDNLMSYNMILLQTIGVMITFVHLYLSATLHQAEVHLILPISAVKPFVNFLSKIQLTGRPSPKIVTFPIFTPASYSNVPFISKTFVLPSYQNSICEIVFCTKLSPSSRYNSPFAFPFLSGAIKSSKSSLRSTVVVFAPLTRRGMIEPPRMCTGISV